MISSGLGDRAQLFTGMRHTTDLKTRLATLTREMASGRAADMVAHLRGDTAPLADLDRRLALAQSYGAAAQEAGQRLSAMEATLDGLDDVRGHVLDQITIPSQGGDPTSAARSARAAFDDIATALNAQWGESALFAGTDTGGPALAPADALWAALRAAMTGALDGADVAARLDTWFDDPSGGFATTGYLGGSTDMSRAVDAGTTVALDVRADDPALRGLLKAAALGALAGDSTLGLPASANTDLLRRSRDAFLSAAVPLTQARAGIGRAQAQAEEAAVRHAARATSWGILRNEMTEADPYATATELEALRSRLETHYEITGRLSSLNLVSFLR